MRHRSLSFDGLRALLDGWPFDGLRLGFGLLVGGLGALPTDGAGNEPHDPTSGPTRFPGLTRALQAVALLVVLEDIFRNDVAGRGLEKLLQEFFRGGNAARLEGMEESAAGRLIEPSEHMPDRHGF